MDQELFRRKYKKLKPDWKDCLQLFISKIDPLVSDSTRILDFGCGHSDFLKDVFSKTPHTYGVDPDEKSISKNLVIKNKFVSTSDILPFENNFFDLVVSSFVFEHLENPEKTLLEIFRVLKPNGRLIFLTPNIWNYNVWISRAVPNFLHNFFTEKFYKRQSGDTFPVRYKINSVAKIKNLSKKVGFQTNEIVLNGDPTYLAFNNFFFKFFYFLEQIFDLKTFQFARVHIIATLKK